MISPTPTMTGMRSGEGEWTVIVLVVTLLDVAPHPEEPE